MTVFLTFCVVMWAILTTIGTIVFSAEFGPLPGFLFALVSVCVFIAVMARRHRI